MSLTKCMQCASEGPGASTGLVAVPPDMCVPLNCEGCGPTFVDREGKCCWPSCPKHGLKLSATITPGEGRKL